MNTKSLWLWIIAVVISFIGGFFLANSLNRGELEALKAENARAKTTQSSSNPNNTEMTLSDEEIQKRIGEADQNPTNTQFQKSLGLALYRYGSMKQDTKLLGDVERILKRAYDQNPSDREVSVTLGNLYFDIGYFNKDNANLQKAREFYEKLLARTPNDVEIRTDNALTYFLQNPPDNDRAIAEFEKSLKDNPKHEKTLQFLIQALLKQGKTQEAESYLAKLKEVNPNTPDLAEIQKQIAQ